MIRHVSSIVLVAALWAAACGSASAAPTPEDISKAVQALGAADEPARDAAHKLLLSCGEPARKALEAAARAGNPDAAQRAQEILVRFSLAGSPGVSDGAVRFAATYLRSGRGARAEMLENEKLNDRASSPVLRILFRSEGDEFLRLALAEKRGWNVMDLVALYPEEKETSVREGMLDQIFGRPLHKPAELAALVRLSEAEKEEELAAKLRAALDQNAGALVAALLLDGKTAEAKKWLDRGVCAQPEERAGDWIALALLTGKLQEKKKLLEAGDDPQWQVAAESLLPLVQAALEAQAPAKPAEAADRSTRSNLPYWRERAAAFEGQDGNELENRASRAFFHRLAGDEAALREDIEAMHGLAENEGIDEHHYLVRGPTKRQYDSTAVEAFLMADLPDEAMAYCLKGNHIRFAFDLLTLEYRFDEALATIRKMADEGALVSADDAAFLGKVFLDAGDRPRAEKMCAQAMEDFRQADVPASPEVPMLMISLLDKLGKKDQAKAQAEKLFNAVANENDARMLRYGLAEPAKFLAREGCKDQAAYLLTRLAELEPGNLEALNEVAAIELSVDLRDSAFKHLQAVATRAVDDETKASACGTILRHFCRRGPGAYFILSVWPEFKALARLPADQLPSAAWKLLEPGNGKVALQAAIRWLELNLPKCPEPAQSYWLNKMAEACEEFGENDLAATYRKRTLALQPDPELAVSEGNRLAREGKWPEALKLYEKALPQERDETAAAPLGQGGPEELRDLMLPYGRPSENDSDDPSVATAICFLKATALRKVGREQEGALLQKRADLALLANVPARTQLAGWLSEIGLKQEAARQEGLVRTLRSVAGRGREQEEGEAPTSVEIGALIDAGDWAQAQRLWADRMVSERFRSSKAYLDSAPIGRLIRAREALAAGKVEEAMAVVRQVLKTSPAASPAILFVGTLQKMGRQKEADEIFGAVFKAGQEACRHFPDDPMYHNDLAWHCAICARELEPALQHALKAIEVSPERYEYLDTLAEVYFQMGQFEKAAEFEKQAVRAGGDPLNRARLEFIMQPKEVLEKLRGPRPAAQALQ